MTPTSNRAHLFPIAVECMLNQTWVKEGKTLEWVIVEDGEQDVQTLLTDLPHNVWVKYVRLDGKHPIGKKRNVCLEHATGDLLFFHDDDDFYHPSHIEEGVALLSNQRQFGVIGSSVLLAYSTRTKSFHVTGKPRRNDSPCGVLGFTRQALHQYGMRFDDEDKHAEERTFLREFRVPILHCDPLKTIVAIQHGENTWRVQLDKKSRLDFAFPAEFQTLLDKCIENK